MKAHLYITISVIVWTVAGAASTFVSLAIEAFFVGPEVASAVGYTSVPRLTMTGALAGFAIGAMYSAMNSVARTRSGKQQRVNRSTTRQASTLGGELPDIGRIRSHAMRQSSSIDDFLNYFDMTTERFAVVSVIMVGVFLVGYPMLGVLLSTIL